MKSQEDGYEEELHSPPHKKFKDTHGKAILIVFPKEESNPVLQVELSWLCFLWRELVNQLCKVQKDDMKVQSSVGHLWGDLQNSHVQSPVDI